MPRPEKKNFYPLEFHHFPQISGISFEVDLCAGLKANCCELLTGNLFDCTYLLVLHSHTHISLSPQKGTPLSGLKRLPNKVKEASCMPKEILCIWAAFFGSLLGMPVQASQGFRRCPSHSHYLLLGFRQSDLRPAHAAHSKFGLIETP